MPIKKEQTALVLGGLKNKMGYLVLFPDSLVFLESSAFSAGAAFGALGALLSASTKSDKSIAEAVQRGKGVTAIPLGELSALRKPRNNTIEIETTTGNLYKFGGISFEKWAPVIQAHLGSRGVTVAASASELRVQR